jgi:hypothetical protein
VWFTAILATGDVTPLAKEEIERMENNLIDMGNAWNAERGHPRLLNKARVGKSEWQRMAKEST